MKAEPLSPTSTIADVTIDNMKKIRLPSGYTLLALPDMEIDHLDRHYDDQEIEVSVYPPGSDCQDKDEQVARFLICRQDADALLRMHGRRPPTFPDWHPDCGGDWVLSGSGFFANYWPDNTVIASVQDDAGNDIETSGIVAMNNRTGCQLFAETWIREHWV